MGIIRRGRKFADYFPDRVWGGRQKALVAAQRFRDELLQRIDPDTRFRRRPPKGTINKTGVVGVTLETYVVDGRVYRRFVAGWRDGPGGICKRRFSLLRYGRKRARLLAIEARQAGMAETNRRALARQREEAAKRLSGAPPMPEQVKDPRDRKGISMAQRRPQRRK